MKTRLVLGMVIVAVAMMVSNSVPSPVSPNKIAETIPPNPSGMMIYK